MAEPRPLETQLQHIRQHLESQIRALDAMQKVLPGLAAMLDGPRAAQIAHLHADLHDIDLAGEMLSFLVKQARRALDEQVAPPE